MQECGEENDRKGDGEGGGTLSCSREVAPMMVQAVNQRDCTQASASCVGVSPRASASAAYSPIASLASDWGPHTTAHSTSKMPNCVCSIGIRRRAGGCSAGWVGRGACQDSHQVSRVMVCRIMPVLVQQALPGYFSGSCKHFDMHPLDTSR